MNGVSVAYFQRAEWWLFINTLTYFLMNGAQVFETAVLVPKWTKAPPKSLKVLQGPFAPDLKTFWIIFHSLHELLFFAALIFCWRMVDVRHALLVILVLHFAVRVWTVGWFAPAIMRFQQLNPLENLRDLSQSVHRWRQLNYLRVSIFVGLSICMAAVLATMVRMPLH